MVSPRHPHPCPQNPQPPQPRPSLTGSQAAPFVTGLLTVLLTVLLAVLLIMPLAQGALAQSARNTTARFITLASTTSTENSGLFAHILPRFTARTGIAVRVVAKGTGQALRLARDGDADVLLVHHRPSEDRFIAAGYGIERRDVMYNDFVLAGPIADPAGVGGSKDVARAFASIARAKAPFVSRGDDSGTHKAELAIWRAAGISAMNGTGKRPGRWYREAGAGMGATLNIAVAMEAYVLADRGSWATFGNRRGLKIVVEGDPRLFNPYGVMLVNPARHPHVKAAEGRAFIKWLTGPEGRAAIASFRVGGKMLFTPVKR